jgi:hypothetical protein
MYPVLKAESSSAMEMSELSTHTSMVLQRAFYGTATEIRVNSLREKVNQVLDEVKTPDEVKEKVNKILDTLDGAAIQDAVSIVDGMPHLISQAVKEYSRGLSVEDLKIDEVVEKSLSEPAPKESPEGSPAE